MKVKDFCGRYSCLAPLLVIITNLLAYYGTHIVNANRKYHDVVNAFDTALPYVPQFIIVYVLAFVQWAVCYIVIVTEDKQKSYYYCAGASLANIICGIIFIAYPTIMTIRPAAGGTGITGFLVRFIYGADTPPVNLFPSIHCLESWMCVRLMFASKKASRTVKGVNLVFSILVFASVLLVKQHAVIDVPAGILSAEAGLFAVRKLKLDEKLIRLEQKILS